MRIEDNLEIKVVVATYDEHDCIIDIYADLREVDEFNKLQRFGFVIVDSRTGRIPDDYDYSDFYKTISDAMNDYRRISMIKSVLNQIATGKTVIEVADIFNITTDRVEKILANYRDWIST